MDVVFHNGFSWSSSISCIVLTNPMWSKGEQNIAERLASAYQFQSDAKPIYVLVLIILS